MGETPHGIPALLTLIPFVVSFAMNKRQEATLEAVFTKPGQSRDRRLTQ